MRDEATLRRSSLLMVEAVLCRTLLRIEAALLERFALRSDIVRER